MQFIMHHLILFKENRLEFFFHRIHHQTNHSCSKRKYKKNSSDHKPKRCFRKHWPILWKTKHFVPVILHKNIPFGLVNYIIYWSQCIGRYRTLLVLYYRRFCHTYLTFLFKQNGKGIFNSTTLYRMKIKRQSSSVIHVLVNQVTI